MPGEESMDCPHCGKAIELPIVEGEDSMIKRIRRPALRDLGGPMAN